MKLFKSIAVIVLITAFLSGCVRKEEEESVKIKEIHEKEGVPVRVEKVERRTMIISKRYSGTLRGEKEASADAFIDGNLEAIFVKIGDYVAKDKIIAKFRENEAASSYRQAKAAYENSLENLKRYESLFEAGAISKQTLDNIRTMFDVDKANYEAAERQIFVKAPISGYVSEIYNHAGDNVHPGNSIAKITDVRDLILSIAVPEQDIMHIDESTKVAIHTPLQNGTAYSGKITRISLTANENTHSFDVDILVDNADNGVLRSGMVVEAELNLIEKENSIYMMRENLISDGENPKVYVVENNKAVVREIEPGISSGVIVEVLSGLNEGDMLVVDGFTLLKPGVLVNIVE
ncbi:efflux RND transporter periplasmic adaptor subunit [bacterium]|nr:efflux RND transporter periplasmic adaptor subunit [bacterium]